MTSSIGIIEQGIAQQKLKIKHFILIKLIYLLYIAVIQPQ